MVSRPEPEIDLAHAALLIAQEERSDLPIEQYLDQLNRWAVQLKASLQCAVCPEHFIAHLNRFLFEDLGFTGNPENYYDPRNSFLDQVMDRRQGIPITLSVIYIEVARRIGFAVDGIGMPGHFLVKPATRHAEFYIDPYCRGQILREEDCARRIEETYAGSLNFQKSFLFRITRKQILTRLLANLKSIYLQNDNHSRALAVVDKILYLSPEAPLEMRDRGILHYRLGHLQEAIIDLQKYLLYVPQARDAQQIRQLILALQARLRAQDSEME